MPFVMALTKLVLGSESMYDNSHQHSPSNHFARLSIRLSWKRRYE